MANNQVVGGSYDAAGNLTALANLAQSMGYDANNKMTSFTGPLTTSNDAGTYVYDGQGNRVKRISTKSGVSSTTTYVYDAFGKLAAEYSLEGPTGAGGTFYRTTDHLGSTRLVTKQNGTIANSGCRDLYPFGERILDTVGNRSDACYDDVTGPEAFRNKFTGKERDDESKLDYFLARYYAGSLGRFNSVDPENAGALLENPQLWNGYVYVGNNPILLSDPLGLARNICDASNNCTFFADRFDDSIDAFFNASSFTIDKTGFIFEGDTLVGRVTQADNRPSVQGDLGAARTALFTDVGQRTTDGSVLIEGAQATYDVANIAKSVARGGLTGALGVTAKGAKQFKKRKSNQSGKDAAKDVPDWAKGQRPFKGEKGQDFAKRVLNDR